MSGVITKMHLSPASAGKLFQRACALEDEAEQLRERVAELEHTLEAAAMDYHMASGGDHLFYVAEALDSSNAGGDR